MQIHAHACTLLCKLYKAFCVKNKLCAQKQQQQQQDPLFRRQIGNFFGQWLIAWDGSNQDFFFELGLGFWVVKTNLIFFEF